MRLNPLDDISILSIFEDDKWLELKKWIKQQNETIKSSDLLIKMESIESEIEFQRQNLTEICRSCGTHLRACQCGWGSKYYKWLVEKH